MKPPAAININPRRFDTAALSVGRCGLTMGELCAGIGGFALAAEWAGWEVKWSNEIDPKACQVLRKNFNHEIIEADIREVTELPKVDVVCAGFPCQDLSIANWKSPQGITGERSGLWKEVWRIVSDIRPKYAFFENSAMLTVRGLERVLSDLAQIGYDAEWQCLHATSFGFQHGRERIYIIAYPMRDGQEGNIKEPIFQKLNIQGEFKGVHPGWRKRSDIPQPRTIRGGHGISKQMDRVGQIGNAVIPLVAYEIMCAINEHQKQLNQ